MAAAAAGVFVWTVAVGSGLIPESLLESARGLVLAAPGTGSLPVALIEQLSPDWTSQMPIVIVSRCGSGNNYDDYQYAGSREKYESRGFRLSGYEQMTPLQARLLLVCRLAAEEASARSS